MLAFRKPSHNAIRAFLASQSQLALQYNPVPELGTTAPRAFKRDHTRVMLGVGDVAFAHAKAALISWRQFPKGWIEVWPADAPIELGKTVAVVAWAAGLWSLNACRIIAVIDESLPHERFGFTYATLPHHAAFGEERFLIERDGQTGAVWYDLSAISRPNGLLPRLGYPMMRGVQGRFRKESAEAMRLAVNGLHTERLSTG
jgi:uncharacterized protein (UPF0548 family)